MIAIEFSLHGQADGTEEYLDWKLEDIAAHLGFERGSVDAWTWTTEAASG